MCRLPVLAQQRLRFRVVKESGALPDNLCLTYVRLDFGTTTFLSMAEHDWHGQNERAMVADRDRANTTVGLRVRALPKVHPKGGCCGVQGGGAHLSRHQLHLPDHLLLLQHRARLLQLLPGAAGGPGHPVPPLLLLPLRPGAPTHSSCLQAVGRFGATNGCSVVPNSWLNEEVRSVWRSVWVWSYSAHYQACVIHDLCYSTLGVTQAACDKQLRSNVNAVHFLQDGWVGGCWADHVVGWVSKYEYQRKRSIEVILPAILVLSMHTAELIVTKVS